MPTGYKLFAYDSKDYI